MYTSSLTQKAEGKLGEKFTHLYPNALIRERSALSVIICSLVSREDSQVKGIGEFLHKSDSLPSAFTYSKDIRRPFNNTTIWQGFHFHFEG